MGACTSNSGEFDYEKFMLKDKNKYSVAIENSEEKECTPIYRHPDTIATGLVEEGIVLPSGDKLETVHDSWQWASKTYSDNPFLGYRPLDAEGKYGDYAFETYKQVAATVASWTKGLASLGIKKEANVGVFAKNRPEWTQSFLAISGRGARVVALYDTLGEEAVKHILEQAEIETVFTEVPKLKLLGDLISQVDTLKLKNVIVFGYEERYGNKDDVVSDEVAKVFADKGIKVFTTKDLAEGGKDVSDADTYDPPKGEDLCNIMYTSGTTGLPKGVMLSHIGLMCLVESITPMKHLMEAGDVHFSYLPLAHIFEMAVENGCIAYGMTISFSTGNMRNLLSDLTAARPHLFCGVPRVYGKFYSKFKAKIDGGGWITKKLVDKAFATSSIYIRSNERSKTYDKLVWNKAAITMGLDRTKLTVTGAAPMPGYLMEFIKIITNCPMVQGYGLTETSAGGTFSDLKDCTVGHVGAPGISTEIRLRDVPEMNYTSTDMGIGGDGKEVPMPRGEIEIRGKCVFKGYYKMPEKTAESLSADGWFGTGDIGRINPNGTLSIIDRKKNIFKLSQGEYIAVEKVENVYSKCASVSQIWVYGNSFKSFIVAVIVPDGAWAQGYLQEKGKWKWDEEKSAILTNEYSANWGENVRANYQVIYDAVFAEMKANTGKLKRFEQIKDIHIETNIDSLLQGFNVENNCLTPSFKLKRPQLLKKYIDQVKELYTKNNEPPQDGEKWLK